MNTRINDSKGFKGIQNRVQKLRNRNQEVDTPKADKELRHRRNREPIVKHKTSYLAQIRYIELGSEIGKSSQLHRRHAVDSGNVKQTKRIRAKRIRALMPNSDFVTASLQATLATLGHHGLAWPSRPRCWPCRPQTSMGTLATSPLGWGGTHRATH